MLASLTQSNVGGKRLHEALVDHLDPSSHFVGPRLGVPPIARAHVYEKLDGTNVLAYRYRDAAGVVRTTFKLRLHPVLRNGTFGGFLDMWRELLARHPEAAALPTRNDCSISFELYGGRNPHLIAYDEPLAMAVLATCRAIRAQGLSFPADKAAVMRLLAPRFTKGEMRRVYGALAAAAD